MLKDDLSASQKNKVSSFVTSFVFKNELIFEVGFHGWQKIY